MVWSNTTTRFAPVLRTVRKGQQLEMRWPASVRSYEVHQNTALIPFQWLRMTGQPLTQGDQQMMVTPMEGASFYRLARVGTPNPN